MKFLLAALPHNSHLQNVALALHERGILGAYRSGAIDNYRHTWSRSARHAVGALIPGLDSRLQRRRVKTIPDQLLYPERSWDGMMALANVLRLGRTIQDRIWEHSELHFDQRCARLMERPQYDAYFGIEHGALQAARVARQLGKPVVVAFLSPHHEALRRSVESEYSQFPELMTPYVERLQRRARFWNQRKDEEARIADVIHSASNFTANSLTRYAGVERDRIMVVPLGAPPAIPSNRLPGVVSAHLRFMYSGPVSVRTGAHYLLQAWRLLAPGSRASLDIYGSMQLPHRVIENLPTSVSVHGHTPHADVLSAYEQASMLVFPTLCDGFGMVVQEAFSMGVPVITTTHAGAADLIQEGRNGFIVPPHDAAALADRMNWCISHPRDVWKMRVAALETANAWTWENFRSSFRCQLSRLFNLELESSIHRA